MTTPQAPVVKALDQMPAFKGMPVDDRTPLLRCVTEEAINAYRYELWEDGVRVESVTLQTSGIATGDKCFSFSPTYVLRYGAGINYGLEHGELYPPFLKSKGRYTTSTYGPSSSTAGHSAYSVDFNKTDGSDINDPVYPASPGTVVYVNRDEGGVVIKHAGGYASTYWHMRDLRVSKGQAVKMTTVLGLISDRGRASGPHLHHQHLFRYDMRNDLDAPSPLRGPLRTYDGVAYKAIKMRFRGQERDGLEASKSDPSNTEDRAGSGWPMGREFVQGPTRDAPEPARFRVAVRRASDDAWSPWRTFDFKVNKRGVTVDPALRTDTGCAAGGGGDPGQDVRLLLECRYTGREVQPGEYSVRFRMRDDLGGLSEWAYDHTLEVTEGDTESLVEPHRGAITASERARVRIFLRDLKSPTHDDGAVQMYDPTPGDPLEYSRGPGEVKAIIDDAYNFGMSEYANSPGEVFFTLPLDHPQLHLCEPWRTHYEVQQMQDGEWVRLGEGILHDLSMGPTDAVVYGYDWLGLMALSVEPAKQPDNNEDALINPPGDDDQQGSKYVNETVSYIIQHQLERAVADEDSPVGFIEVDPTWVDSMPEEVTIHAAFKERLEFIRSMVETYSGGSGARPVVRVRRDPTDGDRPKFEVLENAGQDRPELRLEYGSLLQGFEVVPFGDFATTVYGVGRKPLSAKPLYATKNAYGMDPQYWGRLAKAGYWDNVSDQNDLVRRVMQRAAELGRIGKAVAMAIRVRGLDVKRGWDIPDAIPLAIERGPVNTSFWSPDDDDVQTMRSWWVVWGYEWRSMRPNLDDELTLIVRPRIDSTTPLSKVSSGATLLSYTEAHDTSEGEDWELLAATFQPGGDDMLTGVDSHIDYQPNLTSDLIKQEKGQFSITKLTEGTYQFSRWSSANARKRIVAHRAGGLVAGGYHWLTRLKEVDGDGNILNHTNPAFNSGAKQCDYFVSFLPKDSDGNPDPDGLLCALDVETTSNYVINLNGKRWMAHSPTWTQIKEFVQRWFVLFPDHPLLIYSSSSMWARHAPGKNIKAINSKVFCWSALYAESVPSLGRNVLVQDKYDAMVATVSDPWKPNWGGFSATAIWQYGPFGIKGYAQKVDGNIYKGTLAQLQALANTVATLPEEDPEAYKNGWNALVGAAETAVTAISLPNVSTDYDEGRDDAKAAVLAQLALMELTTT